MPGHLLGCFLRRSLQLGSTTRCRGAGFDSLPQMRILHEAENGHGALITI
jgi:hypothetical protein